MCSTHYCKNTPQNKIYKKLGIFRKLIKAIWIHTISETGADKKGKTVLPFPAISVFSASRYKNRPLSSLRLGG
jgi:hypothetical protein